MRRSVPLLVLLLAGTASCGQGDRNGSPPPQNAPARMQAPVIREETIVAPSAPEAASDSAQQRAAAGPNIGPTAAPGVAFNYRYAFRLAAPRIAEVQEQHAHLCERLTVARCRITGLRYRVVNDRDIEAMLALKLDPAVARHFGRAGVEAVTRAEGMLIESEISGQDVGTDIRRTTRSIAQLNEELRRIEARLAGRISADERARLDYEAQQLRQSIRAAEAGREAQQDSLATTPMVFNYGSGELVPGFADRPTFAKAWDQAWGNVKQGLLAFFVVLVTLAPWIILGLLGWWATIRIRRRWFAKAPAPAEETAATA
jgi:hypothetical protein